MPLKTSVVGMGGGLTGAGTEAGRNSAWLRTHGEATGAELSQKSSFNEAEGEGKELISNQAKSFGFYEV